MKQTLLKKLLFTLLALLPYHLLRAQECMVTTSADNTTLCPGSSAILSGHAAFTPTTWQWLKEGEATPVGTAQTLLVTTAGKYKVVATGPCGAVSSNIVDVKAVSIPNAASAIVGVSKVCPGAKVTYKINSVPEAISYTWSVPAGWSIVAGVNTNQIIVIPGSNTGYVLVRSVNMCGESTSRELLVEVDTSPTAPTALSGSQKICSGELDLVYTAAQVAGARDYFWAVPKGWLITSGQGTSSIHVTPSKEGGVVTVTAQNSCGSSPERTLTVAVGTPVNAPVAEGTSICEGEQATLQVSNPQQDLSYAWFSTKDSTTPLAKGAFFNTPALAASTTFYVEAYNSTGCSSPRTAVIASVEAKLTNNSIGNNQTVCAGQVPQQIAGSNPAGGTGGFIYQWQESTSGDNSFYVIPGANEANYTPASVSATTWFRRVVASGTCQSISNTVKVEVLLPLANNVVELTLQTICAGEAAAELRATTPTGGGQVYTYLWESSMDGKMFTPALGTNSSQHYSPGTITSTTWFRRSVRTASCQSISEAVKITVLPVPDKPTILQTEATLRASVKGSGYEWLKDDEVISASTESVTVTESGAYQVRVQHEEGCYSPLSDKLQVEILPMALPEDAVKAGISTYPNPSQGKVVIQSKRLLHDVQLLVLNPLGNMVFRYQLPLWKASQELDLQHLPQGLYFIHIKSNELQAVQRLIIRK